MYKNKKLLQVFYSIFIIIPIVIILYILIVVFYVPKAASAAPVTGADLDVSAYHTYINLTWTDDTTDANDGDVGDVDWSDMMGPRDHYFGHATTQFDRVYFDVSTAGGSNGDVNFYYWNGTASTSLAFTYSTAPTSAFNSVGINYLEFTPPGDWVTKSLNGVEAYYVWIQTCDSGCRFAAVDQVSFREYVSNNAPTATALSPTQTSATAVTVTSTIADADSDVTSLVVEYSTDNTTWTSSTLITATEASEGDGTTTSTGNIAGIDTDNDGSIALTFTWNIEVDLPDTDDTTVYLRVVPNDGTVNGTTVTSDAFAVDTEDPTVPSALSVSSTSTTAVVLTWPTTTSTDTNFSEYKVFYKVGSSDVSESDSAFTSSTDSNLGDASFNSVTTGTISGLSVGVQYVANIWAYDDYGASTSSVSEIIFYTLANVPVSGSTSGITTSDVIVSWGDNSNPSGTEYYVEDASDASNNSGWTTDTAYTFTGLSAGTSYTFRVKAKNGDDISTSYLENITATTESFGVGIPVATNPPVLLIAPVAQDSGDAESDAVASASVPVAVEVSVQPGVESQSIPNSNHSIGGIMSITPERATIVIHSDPIVVTLDKNKEKGIDTDSDGFVDLKALYLGMDEDKNSKFKFTDLVNAFESEYALTINNGLYSVNTRAVTLYFNVPEAKTMAISNTEDFVDTSFVPYVSSMSWELSAEAGEKVVYARFRSEDGGVSETFDTIIFESEEVFVPEPVIALDDAEATPTCSLTPGRVYKSVGSHAVYEVFENGLVDDVVVPCVKKYFVNAKMFFSHHDSWNVVHVVTQESLDKVPDDDISYMVFGSKYAFASGSLVKATKDSRVFVVIENTKKWIVSESVFSALSYTWDWIEDVSDDLLAKYTEGDAVEEVEMHPAGTVIMYSDSADMYLLEMDVENNNILIKRLVPDLDTLTFLGYRLDRVVIIDESEQYKTGEPIVLHQ
jgi:hypothetical protein